MGFFSLFPSPQSNCTDALPVGFNVWHGETLLNPPHCSLPYEAQYLKSKNDVCLIHKFITSQNVALNERRHALIWNADFRKEVLILKMTLDGLPFYPHPPACLPRPLAFSVVSLALLEMGGRAVLSLFASLSYFPSCSYSSLSYSKTTTEKICLKCCCLVVTLVRQFSTCALLVSFYGCICTEAGVCLKT